LDAERPLDRDAVRAANDVLERRSLGFRQMLHTRSPTRAFRPGGKTVRLASFPSDYDAPCSTSASAAATLGMPGLPPTCVHFSAAVAFAKRKVRSSGQSARSP